MRILKSFGYLLTALLIGFSSGASADWLFRTTQIQNTHWQNVTYGAIRPIAIQPGGVIQVGYSKQLPADSHMIVVRRHATYWVKPVHGQGRIRITVPMEFYLSSWDVKALERELERLGIKVKPKPVPRPKPVVSG